MRRYVPTTEAEYAASAATFYQTISRTGTEREKDYYDLGWRMNVSEREIWEFKKRFRDLYRRW